MRRPRPSDRSRQAAAEEAGPVRPLDADALRTRLRTAAFAYVGRYATTAANLRRVLERKVLRIEGATLDATAPLIDDVIGFCTTNGLVDDAAFAAMKVAAGRAKGLSRAKLKATLAQKGVPADLAAAELPDADDVAGALRLARRKRLGPWRSRPIEDPERKDAAALARAGYPPALAWRVARMSAAEAEALLAGAPE